MLLGVREDSSGHTNIFHRSVNGFFHQNKHWKRVEKNAETLGTYWTNHFKSLKSLKHDKCMYLFWKHEKHWKTWKIMKHHEHHGKHYKQAVNNTLSNIIKKCFEHHKRRWNESSKIGNIESPSANSKHIKTIWESLKHDKQLQKRGNISTKTHRAAVKQTSNNDKNMENQKYINTNKTEPTWTTHRPNSEHL